MAPHDPQQSVMQDLAVRWTQSQPVVAAFIASVVPSHHDVEEILQRTAATLVAKSADYNPDRPFVNWAIGLARIEMLRMRTERRRERELFQFDSETLDALAAATVRLEPEADEMRLVLHQCLRKLQGHLRTIIELSYGQGLSPAEIAATVGRSANAVSVALHRGRTSLRQCMERHFGLAGGDL